MKSVIFSYIEAGVASAIVLAYAGGAQQPIDFLWAFVAGFAGPLVKAINPLDKSFGLKLPTVPSATKGTAAQVAVADAIAKAVVTQVEVALTPSLDKVAAAVEPVVAPVVEVVAPVIDAAVKATKTK